MIDQSTISVTRVNGKPKVIFESSLSSKDDYINLSILLIEAATIFVRKAEIDGYCKSSEIFELCKNKLQEGFLEANIQFIDE